MRALRQELEVMSDRLDEALSILDAAYEEHRPTAIFLMFSGGHDSLTAAHIGATWAKLRSLPFAAAHINTGIGVEQTRIFVRETCKRESWSLIELRSQREVEQYEYQVLTFGFPGPAWHNHMYNRLKKPGVQQLVREHKQRRSDRIFLINGMRRQESARRMKHVDFQRRDGAQVWVSPLEHWSRLDCARYIAAHNLRRNEVSDVLHMSGECLCGAYARPHAMTELEQWYPETAAYIHDLERRVEAAGRVSCVWGYSARFVQNISDDQTTLFSPLCASCEAIT